MLNTDQVGHKLQTTETRSWRTKAGVTMGDQTGTLSNR